MHARYARLICVRDRSALLNFKNIQNHRRFFLPFFFYHGHALTAVSQRWHASGRICRTRVQTRARAESMLARSLRACKSNSLDTNNSRTNPIASRNDISTLHAHHAEMILFATVQKKIFNGERTLVSLKMAKQLPNFTCFF